MQSQQPLWTRVGSWLSALRQWASDNPPFSRPAPEPIDSLDPTRRRILDYISAHPGAHLRDVCRSLGLAMGDVQYHVRRLERDGRITSARRGLYKFLYPADLFGERQREVLSMLSLDTPRELLLNIIDRPDSTQVELAAATSISQPTASWHLKRLVELGIVGRRQDGRAVTYRTPVGGEIATFVRAYHPTVWERWSSRLADIFIAYSGQGMTE